MDSSLRQSPSFGRISSINVSQLDKINAIPNKTTDNILMDGLCQEDQLYLNALMDDELSDSDEHENSSRRSSAWSPMAQSPVIMNKRIRKLRPSYTITMSLEDISYIRPSWGMSKGVKRIEINKNKAKKEKLHAVDSKESKGGVSEGRSENQDSKSLIGLKTAYHSFLGLLLVIVVLIIVLRYVVVHNRSQERILKTRIQVDPTRRTFEVFRRRRDGTSDKVLTAHFGQEIPDSLKSDDCTCRDYLKETERFVRDQVENDGTDCISCLDWALRTNLRIEINRTRDGGERNFCYRIKWQSYDSLRTPLMDCYDVGEGQWFGLGDIQNPNWPLNQLKFGRTLLLSNLTGEFVKQTDNLQNVGYQLTVGSYIDFSVLSTSGIYLGNIKTDLSPSVEIRDNFEKGTKELCISVSGPDKSSQVWSSNFDGLDEFKFKNNFFEYSICSSENWRNLVSELVKKRVDSSISIAQSNWKLQRIKESGLTQNVEETVQNFARSQQELEPRTDRLSSAENTVHSSLNESKNEFADSLSEKLPKSIGLLERAIFTTSPEFMPILDGKTLRQHVDKIVKLGFSPILLVDTRWQTYVGSLKIDSALFPKSKLLFEILHNKGFKILLTVKPYLDMGIGTRNINQLLEANHLCTIAVRQGTSTSSSAGAVRRGHLYQNETYREILRRRSFFKFETENITLDNDKSIRIPYLCLCRGSTEGSCAIVDLTSRENRNWLTEGITKSTLLTQQVDGIAFEGTHPNSYLWDSIHRKAMSELIDDLFYKENLYTLPKYSGNFNYIQLAPRHRNWESLKSIINSILNLSASGISLVNPGSVWGDLSSETNSTRLIEMGLKAQDLDQIGNERSDEELLIRWLQVGMFLPVLQFNDLAPIEKYSLQDMLHNLAKIRKNYIVPEIRRNLPLTPLIGETTKTTNLPTTGGGDQQLMPLIRPVWISQERDEIAASEQFMVGPEILVAPILGENLRQRDIYLSSGFWIDELRQTNIRGGKWLRNYPVELNEIAWFTRTKR